MDHLLYVAMTGARENMVGQAVHANNLANVSTTGFYRDFEQARSMPVFGEGHPSRVYAMTERPATDFLSGSLLETGNDLDVAIKGDGFLVVGAPTGGEAYTRAGDLLIDNLGTLRTGAGLPVLGDGGPITVPPAQKVIVGNDGTISIVPLGAEPDDVAVLDRIRLVKPDYADVEKGTDGLFRRRDGQPAEADASVRLAQGFVEQSNVNVVEEMTDVMMLSRQFEMQVKMMRTAEDNDSHAARLLQNL